MDLRDAVHLADSWGVVLKKEVDGLSFSIYENILNSIPLAVSREYINKISELGMTDKVGAKRLKVYMKVAQGMSPEVIAKDVGYTVSENTRRNIRKYFNWGKELASELGLPDLSTWIERNTERRG